MNKWIQKIPLVWLVLIAGWLAIAPVQPEPHLLEKWRLLLNGELSRPIDWFDWLFHTLPLLVLGWRVVLALRSRRQMGE